MKNKKVIELQAVLDGCKDRKGNMIRIPIITTLRQIDGKLVCEVEGYTNASENIDDIKMLSKPILH